MTETKATTMKKVTKKDMFGKLLTIPAVAENEQLVQFIEHEIELLAKKNASGTAKATPRQKENEGIKSAIVEFMKPDTFYSISEFIAKVPECAELTNQRVSALITQLCNEGKIVRTVEKRKAYFSLAK